MEIAMTDQKHNRRRKAHLGREAGQALVETALTMPILVLLLVGAAELARVAYAAVEVSNAAKAAVAYGARTPTQSTDTPGMQTAALADAGDLAATLTTTPTTAGICSSGASCTGTGGSCKNSDCSTPGDHIETILTVQTSATFDPLIHLPGIPTTFALDGQAVQTVMPK
jgi:Flp pilus assembly protein TadG